MLRTVNVESILALLRKLAEHRAGDEISLLPVLGCLLEFFVPSPSKLAVHGTGSSAANAAGRRVRAGAVRQFTVFLENRVGRLQNLLNALESPRTSRPGHLFLEESGESTLVRLICADPDAARKTLHEAAFPFGELDLIAVQTPKKNPQPLSSICSVLLSAEINIHYLYPFLIGLRGPAWRFTLTIPSSPGNC